LNAKSFKGKERVTSLIVSRRKCRTIIDGVTICLRVKKKTSQIKRKEENRIVGKARMVRLRRLSKGGGTLNFRIKYAKKGLIHSSLGTHEGKKTINSDFKGRPG